VWIDGEWTWEGTRYAWKRGRWVEPPSGAKFSPWTGTRDAMGVYYVAEGTWRDTSGKDLPEPPELASGSPRGGAPVTPEGEQVVPTPPVIGQEDGGIIVDAAPDVIIPKNDASPLEGDAS
jgi:hypothetical protein